MATVAEGADTADVGGSEADGAADWAADRADETSSTARVVAGSEASDTRGTGGALLLGLQQIAGALALSRGRMSVRQTGHREALRSQGCTQAA